MTVNHGRGCAGESDLSSGGKLMCLFLTLQVAPLFYNGKIVEITRLLSSVRGRDMGTWMLFIEYRMSSDDACGATNQCWLKVDR